MEVLLTGRLGQSITLKHRDKMFVAIISPVILLYPVSCILPTAGWKGPGGGRVALMSPPYLRLRPPPSPPASAGRLLFRLAWGQPLALQCRRQFSREREGGIRRIETKTV